MSNNIETNENRNFSVFRLLFNLIKIVLTLLITFIALVVIIQRVSNNQVSFLGFRIFRVETGSMIPKYMIGDVILVKEKDMNKIKVGDDLVYIGNYGQVNGRTITHQVVNIEEKDGERLFHTKGLANSSEDPLVSETQVKGVVVRKVYILSVLFNLLFDTYASYFIIVVPLTIYVAFSFIHKARDREEKERRKR